MLSVAVKFKDRMYVNQLNILAKLTFPINIQWVSRELDAKIG